MQIHTQLSTPSPFHFLSANVHTGPSLVTIWVSFAKYSFSLFFLWGWGGGEGGKYMQNSLQFLYFGLFLVLPLWLLIGNSLGILQRTLTSSLLLIKDSGVPGPRFEPGTSLIDKQACLTTPHHNLAIRQTHTQILCRLLDRIWNIDSSLLEPQLEGLVSGGQLCER